MQLQQICAVHSEGASEAEKEELMRALVGAQESAAVQILLEACLPATSPDVNTFRLRTHMYIVSMVHVCG